MTPVPIETLLRFVQPLNVSLAMYNTLFGIEMLVSPEPENAAAYIVVTLFGRVILVSPVQFWKALEPMLVSFEPGPKLTVDRFEHPSKA